jgi:hypothetical protein
LILNCNRKYETSDEELDDDSFVNAEPNIPLGASPPQQTLSGIHCYELIQWRVDTSIDLMRSRYQIPPIKYTERARSKLNLKSFLKQLPRSNKGTQFP